MDLISFGTYDFDAENEKPVNHTNKHEFWRFTLYEILTLICTAAIPIALTVYTVITTQQDQEEADRKREFDLNRAEELRQQSIYNEFLKTMYSLDKDGYLDINDNPWIFANAYHRAAHRQWDIIRKVDALQFLKDKRLIGIAKNVQGRAQVPQQDKISLDQLNFDDVTFKSPTGSLNQLDLRNIAFDRVSMINATFSFVDLDGSSFNNARLNQVQFRDTSLASTIFNGTDLQDTDFGNSNLEGSQFVNVNLSNTQLSPSQLQQVEFVNAILPNGTVVRSTTTTAITTRTTTTTPLSTTQTTTVQQQSSSTTQNNSNPSTNANTFSTIQSTEYSLTTDTLKYTTMSTMQSSSAGSIETTSAEGSGDLSMTDFDYVLSQRLAFPYVQDSASTTTKSTEFLTANNYQSLLVNKKDRTCADMPCQNDGTCVDTNNGGAYICQCTSEYRGDNCENSV